MDISKTFLIATVRDRMEGLEQLLISLQAYNRHWKYVIVAQSYKQEDKDWLDDWVDALRLDAKIIFVNEGIGPGRAKRLGISKYQSDIWLSLDDDMEAVRGMTDYDRMADVLMDRRDIGFLSGNWAKTEAQARNKELKNTLIKQPIVYTGGGMMFRGDVAETLLAEMPDEPWLFDNVAWSLAVYVSGYENYRYLGSVAVHRICTKGGRKNWVRQDKRVLPDQTLITLRPASNDARKMELGNCWHIGDSKDLTEKAKALHKGNFERRFKLG